MAISRSGKLRKSPIVVSCSLLLLEVSKLELAVVALKDAQLGRKMGSAAKYFVQAASKGPMGASCPPFSLPYVSTTGINVLQTVVSVLRVLQ